MRITQFVLILVFRYRSNLSFRDEGVVDAADFNGVVGKGREGEYLRQEREEK